MAEETSYEIKEIIGKLNMWGGNPGLERKAIEKLKYFINQSKNNAYKKIGTKFTCANAAEEHNSSDASPLFQHLNDQSTDKGTKVMLSEFYEKATGYKYGEITTDQDSYKVKADRKIFLGNYLKLLDIVVKPEVAQPLMLIKWDEFDPNDNNNAKNKFETALKELAFKAKTYTDDAKNIPDIISKVENNPDYTKENIFQYKEELGKDELDKEELDNKTNTGISFSGSFLMNEMEKVEQCEALTDSQSYAKKAMIYMDLKNFDLALKYADYALDADKENGIAWMVKGMVRCEDTGTSGGTVSRSEFLRRASLHNPNDTDMILLNAWKYLPKTLKQQIRMLTHKGWVSTPVYPLDHPVYNEKVLIRMLVSKLHLGSLFSTPEEDTKNKLHKKLFLELLERDFPELSFTDIILTPAYFMKLLLLVHQAEPEVEQRIAKQWADSVLKVKTTSNLLHNKLYASGVKYLSSEINSLAKILSVLPHDEVIVLSYHVISLCQEIERQRHLEAFHKICWEQFNKSNGNLLKQFEMCNLTLNSPLFQKDEFDQSLLKEWSYLKLRLIAELSLEYIHKDDWDNLATFFTGELNTTLLEKASELTCIPKSKWMPSNILNDAELSFKLTFRKVKGLSFDPNSPIKMMMWFNVLHKEADSVLKASPDDYDKVSLQGKSVLSFLLDIVLKNIHKKSDTVPELERLRSKCDQIFHHSSILYGAQQGLHHM